MRIICALLRARNRTPGNSGSVVSDSMAGMWKFELRPEGQLWADTGGSRSRPSHPVTALFRQEARSCGLRFLDECMSFACLRMPPACLTEDVPPSLAGLIPHAGPAAVGVGRRWQRLVSFTGTRAISRIPYSVNRGAKRGTRAPRALTERDRSA